MTKNNRVSENIYTFQPAHFSPPWTVVWEMRSYHLKGQKPHFSRTLLSWKLVFFHIHLSTENRTLLLKSYSVSKSEAKFHLLKLNPHRFCSAIKGTTGVLLGLYLYERDSSCVFPEEPQYQHAKLQNQSLYRCPTGLAGPVLADPFPRT